ncbi:MAG: DUF167 domain-containing protein [Mucispirillum sp.]|nr:DUF167 domain-containing protein [Mucispirillum sp.]
MKITLYIQPGAKKGGYAGLHDGIPKIKIKARPSEGAANEEVTEVIAGLLNIPKSRVSIISGLTSRIKILEIDAPVTLDEIMEVIRKY